MTWSIFTDGGGDQVAVGWAKELLNGIGAPDTPGNEQFIYDWEKSEGGGGKYNPLNQGPVPGHSELTSTGQQYGGGAADFVTWAAGLQGAVDYLNMSNYSQVRDALKANNPTGARSALWASPWAASHYGYGSSWSNAALPGGTPVLPNGGTPSNGSPGATNTGLTSTILDKLLSLFGVPDIKDLAERGGLIVFGGVLVLVGLFVATKTDQHVKKFVQQLPEEQLMQKGESNKGGKSSDSEGTGTASSEAGLAPELEEAAVVAV